MIKAIKKLFEWLYGLLKPFDVTKYIDQIYDSLKDSLGWVNWLIPFKTILTIYTVWLTCVGSYYVFVMVKPIVMNLIKRLFSAKIK